jgi:hypothetical protein
MTSLESKNPVSAAPVLAERRKKTHAGRKIVTGSASRDRIALEVDSLSPALIRERSIKSPLCSLLPGTSGNLIFALHLLAQMDSRWQSAILAPYLVAFM